MIHPPIQLSDAENDAILRNLKPWNRPTAAQVRNAVIADMFLVPREPEGQPRKGLDGVALAEGFKIAVQSGRMFDLGHLPNEVIQDEASRGAELLIDGHIGHPFTEPYCFFHTWDSSNLADEEAASQAREVGCTQSGAIYLVDPLDWSTLSQGRVPPGTFLICEAQTIKVYDKPMLLLADSVMVTPERSADGKVGYSCQVSRGALSTVYQSETAAAGNLIDPVMTCLLLLATDGIEVATIEAPFKLNKHRIAAGKPVIPSHYEVKAAGYVTALTQRRTRRHGAPTGHHAAPLPHLRRGHLRRLHAMHGGGTVWVRDAVVNLKDPNAPLARSFYQSRLDAGHTPRRP